MAVDPHLNDLERLAQLRDRGIITQEEFDDEKQQVLNVMNEPTGQTFQTASSKLSPPPVEPQEPAAATEPIAAEPLAVAAKQARSSKRFQTILFWYLLWSVVIGIMATATDGIRMGIAMFLFFVSLFAIAAAIFKRSAKKELRWALAIIGTILFVMCGIIMPPSAKSGTSTVREGGKSAVVDGSGLMPIQ